MKKNQKMKFSNQKIAEFLLTEGTETNDSAVFYFADQLEKSPIEDLIRWKLEDGISLGDWIAEEDYALFLSPALEEIKAEAKESGFSDSEAEYAAVFLASLGSGLQIPNPLAEEIDKSDELVEWINGYEF